MTTNSPQFRRIEKTGVEIRLPDALDTKVRMLAIQLRTSQSAIITAALLMATGTDPGAFGLADVAEGIRVAQKAKKAG